jgi:hypothetical protein
MEVFSAANYFVLPILMKICGIYFSNLLNSVGTAVYPYVFNWNLSLDDIEKVRNLYHNKNFNALWFKDEKIPTVSSSGFEIEIIPKKDPRFKLIENYFSEVPYSIVLFKDGYFMATDLMYPSYSALLFGLVNACRNAKKEYKFETKDIESSEIESETSSLDSKTSKSSIPERKYQVAIANSDMIKKDCSLIRGWIYSKKYDISNEDMTSLFDAKLDLSSDNYRAADLLKLDIIAHRRFLSLNGKLYNGYTMYESMCMSILMTNPNFAEDLFSCIQPYIIPRNSNTMNIDIVINKEKDTDKGVFQDKTLKERNSNILFANDNYLVYKFHESLYYPEDILACCINLNNPENKLTFKAEANTFELKNQNAIGFTKRANIDLPEKYSFRNSDNAEISIWMWRLDQDRSQNTDEKIIPTLITVDEKYAGAKFIGECDEGLMLVKDKNLYLARIEQTKPAQPKREASAEKTTSIHFGQSLPVLFDQNLSDQFDRENNYYIEKLEMKLIYTAASEITIPPRGMLYGNPRIKDGDKDYLIDLKRNSVTQIDSKDYINTAFDERYYLTHDDSVRLLYKGLYIPLVPFVNVISIPYENYVCQMTKKGKEKT